MNRTGNIENLIAQVIKRHDRKREQLERVQDICIHLTSDDGIMIDCELYSDNICRFLITGTRCSMTITYNTLTWELTRKPRGKRPWHTDWIHANAGDILNRA